MKVLDNYHSYILDLFAEDKPGVEPYPMAIAIYGESLDRVPYLHFYEMKENGEKIDGVTNEEVLRVLIHRLEALNEKFSCAENRLAIDHLNLALGYLNARTRDRVGRGVEGKMEP